jgi:hypothetical protein
MFFTRRNGTAEPITERAKVDSDLSSFYERQYQLSEQVDKVVPGLQYLGGHYSYEGLLNILQSTPPDAFVVLSTLQARSLVRHLTERPIARSDLREKAVELALQCSAGKTIEEIVSDADKIYPFLFGRELPKSGEAES